MLLLLRIEVLTVASMKMAAFWVVALCSVVEVYRRFRAPLRCNLAFIKSFLNLLPTKCSSKNINVFASFPNF
jgi:uncharacterized protein YbgA (DUF1722 family)